MSRQSAVCRSGTARLLCSGEGARRVEPPLQGQLEGALAEGGAIELVVQTSHLGRGQQLLDREIGVRPLA